MNPIGIQLRRQPYEEPDFINLIISVNNGRFAGQLSYYCDTTDLVDIGKALEVFPRKVPDIYSYELGSADPLIPFAFYFLLQAYTIDRSGHCALQISIDNRNEKPNEGSCCFSFETEPSAINRLGRLLLLFSELKHDMIVWSLSGDNDNLIKNDNGSHNVSQSSDDWQK